MLRNKEIQRFACLYLALAGAATLTGFVLGPAAGLVALVMAVVLGVAFFLFTRARYRNLARLSAQIDKVLHSSDQLELDEVAEGELSILHSEITKMTRRLREQNEALKQDKQYLADSLADIAHQLRTPLTSVHLLSSFLAKNPDEAERQAFSREMESLLLRMDWLITSLLKLSRLDAGVVDFRHEPVPVADLIQAALQPLAIPLELRGIELRIELPDEAVIIGDAGWLAEALQNILKNCLENTPENGVIEITCLDNTLYTEINIHDSGPGFDVEDIAHLFDRFYRGKNADATGYGIGLALSQMIVSRQGGSVTARNHPRSGALFALRFPK